MKVTLAKGVQVSKGEEEKRRTKAGSSNVGRYKTVKPKEFAGASGGADKYSFPINDLKHAKAALSRAHFAPNPSGIQSKVYREYPELRKRMMKHKGATE